jgi:hypothetical protein
MHSGNGTESLGSEFSWIDTYISYMTLLTTVPSKEESGPGEGQGITLDSFLEGFNPDPWSDVCSQTEPFTSTKKDKPLGI